MGYLKTEKVNTAILCHSWGLISEHAFQGHYIQFLEKDRTNKHCSLDSQWVIEITFCTITLSSTTVVVQRLEKQSWFLQVKCWRLGFVCTTGKPRVSLYSLEGFCTKLLLSGPHWAESSPEKAPLCRGKAQRGKAVLENELLHRNRMCLSQVTVLYLIFSNDWLTRQETYGLLYTASGNYFWDREK